ncbi:outer membrane protein assembly factor BamB family protein [Desertivirga brevis]|uniref:outer membrane protein assembly factor BamB family protein n=1 Tax=Desertivirga brevis TaxID=2810310 RepID=UPI001A9719D6|nr:PQQ-binding-like beta-propeller repeat protein [Pedobacter sp. SYSU D00873]
MKSSNCIFLGWLFILLFHSASAQSLKFAFISDTHIGNPTAAEDLRRTVLDVNANPLLEFAVITGDVTEFGSDEELKLAKQILDSLSKPWYIIAGNHDSNWSESGSNSFRRVFGGETFSLVKGGYLFVGTSSGPNMRMGPGQIPRENIVWLDSVLSNMRDPGMPIIYLNHYPQDSAQNNWYEALDRLKKTNVQLVLCGHGHSNKRFSVEGIPSVMGRSNLRAKDSVGGYTIVTIANSKAIFEERKLGLDGLRKWAEVDMFNHQFTKDTTKYFRPSFAVNEKFNKVKLLWEYQDQSDIGAGTASSKKFVFATDTKGLVYALNKNDGKRAWMFKTGGKIYSTPAVEGDYLTVGSSDNFIYCLSASSGKLIWKYEALKPVLGSPVIKGNQVFVGSSDGHFRSLDLKSGKLLWDFDDVKGFVVTKPLIYEGIIYFGCWANDFYALDIKNGKLIWKWNNGALNRMFSPAACYPVAAKGKVFIVAPDRYMTAFNAKTGEVIWRKQMKDVRVRESMGLSEDSSLVYVKTMDGELYGISTAASDMDLAWKASLKLPYELTPSTLIENNGVVFIPSHSGLASAIDRSSGKVLWQYKTSNCLMNPIMPLDKNKVIVSTMDGKIACLEYSYSN